MKRFYLLIVLIIISLSSVHPAYARIGDTKTELEKRLTYNRRAVDFEDPPWNRAPTPLRNLEQLLNGLESTKMSIDFETVYYFKRDKDENIDKDERTELANIPGWLLQVLYVNGRSVAEGYVRNQGSLTENERNGLLLRQADTQRWVTEQNLTEEIREAMQLDTYQQLLKHNLSTDEKILQILEKDTQGSDQNYYRTDAKVAAAQYGRSIVFYDIAFHNRIAELDEAYKSETVAESLEGF